MRRYGANGTVRTATNNSIAVQEPAVLPTVSPQPTKGTRAFDLDRLKGAVGNNWDTLLAIVCSLGVGIAAAVQIAISPHMNAYTVPLFDATFVPETHQVDDEAYHFYTPVLNASAAFAVGWWVFGLAMAWMVLTLLEVGVRYYKLVTVKDGMNLFRWLPNSLVDPLAAMILLALLWNVSTFQLLTIFILYHVCSIGGLYLEASNSPSRLDLQHTTEVNDGEVTHTVHTTSTQWPNLFTMWIGLLTLVIPIVTIALNPDRGSISSLVYAAASIFLLQGAGNALIQTAYYAYVRTPSMGFGLFKPGLDSMPSNYSSYNRMLTAVTSIGRTITYALMIAAVSERKHVVYPDAVSVECTYDICQPRAVTGLENPFVPFEPGQPVPYVPRRALAGADPSPTPYPAYTMQVPKVCAKVSGDMSIVSPSGFSNVDATVNAHADTPISPGSASALTATFHTACQPNWPMFQDHFFALGTFGEFYPHGAFNYSACCDPENFDPRVAKGCYGIVFTSKSLSTVGVDLVTNTFGNALKSKNMGKFVVGNNNGVGYVYSDDTGFTALFDSFPHTINGTTGQPTNASVPTTVTDRRMLAARAPRPSASARPHKPTSHGSTHLHLHVLP